MKKRCYILDRLCVGLLLIMAIPILQAQTVDSLTKLGSWSYARCVDYAKANNIKLQQSVLSKQSGLVTLEAAKAQWFPTLNAATTQGFTNYPSAVDGRNKNNYSGTYGLNAGWTVLDGGNRSNSIKKSQINDQINDLAIDEIYNNLETEILTDYLEILYAKESIEIAKQTLEVSKMQMERAEKLMTNLDTVLDAIAKAKPAAAKGQYFKSATIATTMGPGVRVATNKYGV